MLACEVNPVRNPRAMTAPMRLYINVDHVATVRQARRTDEPDPVEAALPLRGRRRGRHHRASARGPPPHPGPRSGAACGPPCGCSTSSWRPAPRSSASDLPPSPVPGDPGARAPGRDHHRRRARSRASREAGCGRPSDDSTRRGSGSASSWTRTRPRSTRQGSRRAGGRAAHRPLRQHLAHRRRRARGAARAPRATRPTWDCSSTPATASPIRTSFPSPRFPRSRSSTSGTAW